MKSVVHLKALVDDSSDFATMPSIRLLGIRIQSVTMPQTLEILTAMALSGRPHHIVTVNSEFIMLAQKNTEFQKVLNRAHLAVPDGMGIVWGARLLGLPMQERTTGVDIVEQLAGIVAGRGLGMFLLGAAPGIAEKAASELCARHPELIITGTFSGSPRKEDEEEIVARVTSARPHFLFVAYGSPAQEFWIGRNLHRLNVPVVMGVGGTFDFVAGVAVRAPKIMQRLGLEWLHRLIREPFRWRRMLALPRFVVALFAARWSSQAN